MHSRPDTAAITHAALNTWHDQRHWYLVKCAYTAAVSSLLVIVSISTALRFMLAYTRCLLSQGCLPGTYRMKRGAVTRAPRMVYSNTLVETASLCQQYAHFRALVKSPVRVKQVSWPCRIKRQSLRPRLQSRTLFTSRINTSLQLHIRNPGPRMDQYRATWWHGSCTLHPAQLLTSF